LYPLQKTPTFSVLFCALSAQAAKNFNTWDLSSTYIMPVKFYPDLLRFARVIREKPILSIWWFHIMWLADSYYTISCKRHCSTLIYINNNGTTCISVDCQRLLKNLPGSTSASTSTTCSVMSKSFSATNSSMCEFRFSTVRASLMISVTFQEYYNRHHSCIALN